MIILERTLLLYIVSDFDEPVILLKLTGLPPDVTKDVIEAYISGKTNDDVEVKNFTFLEKGDVSASASASIIGLKGIT